MKKRPLILDNAGGVDDAQALLMLIGAGFTPDAITTVFGNVGLEAATENILTTLAVAGFEAPVHMGADRPLSQPIIDATYVHGDDGLGGAPRPDVIASPAGRDAVQYLRETFRRANETGDRVDILMIGPLTNLALALRLEPSIVDGIGTLTIMGGTVYGRGNTTPAAEFNIIADAEAAYAAASADQKQRIALTVGKWLFLEVVSKLSMKALPQGVKDGYEDSQLEIFRTVIERSNSLKVEVAQAIAQQFGDIGVKVDQEVLDWSVYTQEVPRPGPIYMLGWGSTQTLDADAAVYAIMRSGEPYSTVDIPELDALLDDSRKIVDPEARKNVLEEIQKLAAETVPLLTLYQEDALYAKARNVAFAGRPDARIPVYDIKLTR